MLKVLAFLPLVACSLPSLANVGEQADSGTCEVIVLPGDCTHLKDLADAWARYALCEWNATFSCGCRTYGFGKTCVQPAADSPYWDCSGNGTYWCVVFFHLSLDAGT